MSTKTTWRPRVLFVLSLLAAHGSWADQITLKNGDRVTGAIVKKDGKTLTIKTESLGTVTVPWEQVVTIQSDAPLNVVLTDGKTVQATLQTLTPAEVVTIRNADEQRAYERLLRPGWGQLWAGTATIGLAGRWCLPSRQVMMEAAIVVLPVPPFPVIAMVYLIVKAVHTC